MAHPEDFESRAYGSGRNRQANIRVLSSFYLERQIGADGAVSQVQVNSQNRQRVLSVELTAREGGAAASGTLVMPFGLALDQGVVLSIDEGEPLPPLRFSTCLPVGCLVPLTFDVKAVTAMRAGTALKVKSAASNSGQEVNFSISLSGFTSALARVAKLSGA